MIGIAGYTPIGHIAWLFHARFPFDNGFANKKIYCSYTDVNNATDVTSDELCCDPEGELKRNFFPGSRKEKQ